MSTLLVEPANRCSHRAVTVAAPAKINLTLDVLGRRDDGYHEVRSLAIGVGLYDDVCCRLADDDEIVVVCSNPALSGPGNLAAAAAQRLRACCGIGDGVHIAIEKRIPIGAGLGGGSSDAAAALRACSELWQTGLDNRDLAKIGSHIGSDVPLFFTLPSALIEGRGERTRPAPLRWSGWVLLVYPGFPVSTAEVYRAWRTTDVAGSPPGDPLALSQAATAAELSPLLTNQLEPAAFRVCPMLADLRQALLQDEAIGEMGVSGSGSTLFRLFDDADAARRAAKRVHDRSPQARTFIVEAPVQATWKTLLAHEEP